LASIEHWRELLGGKLKAAERKRGAVGGTGSETLADMAYGMMQGALILSRVLDFVAMGRCCA
jgi:hypothetical protein